MKTKLLLFLFVIGLTACNPYKGFKGVDKKGMGNTLPSQQVKQGYEKSTKKQARAYKREMRKRAKRMGTTKKR